MPIDPGPMISHVPISGAPRVHGVRGGRRLAPRVKMNGILELPKANLCTAGLRVAHSPATSLWNSAEFLATPG